MVIIGLLLLLFWDYSFRMLQDHYNSYCYCSSIIIVGFVASSFCALPAMKQHDRNILQAATEAQTDF